MAPSQKFKRFEVVRIKVPPCGRACLVGEMGTVVHVDRDGEGRTIYGVDVYRGFHLVGLTFMQSYFPGEDLESTGEFDGLFGDQEVKTAAVRAFERSVASQQLYLCAAGGMGVTTPGIGELDKKVVAGLPRRTVAAGCMDPMLIRGCTFAGVFNREMVKYLLEGKVDDALR